jgi:hypothetical protein
LHGYCVDSPGGPSGSRPLQVRGSNIVNARNARPRAKLIGPEAAAGEAAFITSERPAVTEMSANAA